MACLPNCGVLDLTSIRPRRTQDAIFHSMNLAPAAQHALSGACQAGLNSGSTYEAYAHWDTRQTMNALAMHNAPAILDDGMGAFPRPSAPSSAAPVPASLIAPVEAPLESRHRTTTVGHPHPAQDVGAPRRAPKRAASRSLDQYAPAKRGAFSLSAYRHCQADADVRSGTGATAANWWPAQHTSLPHHHLSQGSPSTNPPALQENATAAVLASWLHGLPKHAQPNWNLHQGQLSTCPQSQATAPGAPAGAVEAHTSSSSSDVAKSLKVMELLREYLISQGELPESVAHPCTVAPCVGQLGDAAGRTASQRACADDTVMAKLQQLQAGADAQLDVPLHQASYSALDQCAAVSGAMTYAPASTDAKASVWNAASEEAQLAHMQNVMAIASGGALSVHQSAHITPVALTAINSAHSVHTSAQVPGEDPFRYLQQSPAVLTHSQDLDQPSQQQVEVTAAAQQPVCLNAIRDAPVGPVSGPQPSVFDSIHEHDAVKCLSLAPLRTTCPEETTSATAVATNACPAYGPPLVTSGVPLMGNAVQGPLKEPLATVAAALQNPDTEAALELLQRLQPVGQLWHPTASVLGDASLAAVAVPERHGVQHDVVRWDGTGHLI